MTLLGPSEHFLVILAQFVPLPFQNRHVQVVRMLLPHLDKDTIVAFDNLTRLETTRRNFVLVLRVLIDLVVSLLGLEVFPRHETFSLQSPQNFLKFN